MPDLSDAYEIRRLQALHRTEREILKHFDSVVDSISINLKTITYKGQVFALKDFPLLNKRVTEQLKGLTGKINVSIKNGVTASWNLANEKNNKIVDKRLAGKTPTKRRVQILYDPNKPALDAFLSRKKQGLNLSGRVWKLTRGYRKELESEIGKGISEGLSAPQMARKLKKYLREPDKRLHKGSKNWKAYKPGQGVFRSSYKNALRVAKEETNQAYRRAEQLRWEKMPFIIGYTIELSNAHKTYDICDRLAGKQYPKDFVWAGWHIGCLCNKRPLQISDEDYSKYEDFILGLTDKAPEISQIEKMPAAFDKWVKDNRERIEGWKAKPFWIAENPSFTKKLLKGK